MDSRTSSLRRPKAFCAFKNRSWIIAPYLFIKKPIIGNGIKEANVNGQFIVNPIIATIINIKVDESTKVKIPNPAVIEIAFKSFVDRAIRSPVRNLSKKAGDISKKWFIKRLRYFLSKITAPLNNV